MKALLLVLAACGPTVIWSGRTPDRASTVEVIHDGGLDFVVVDGKRRAAYRGIAGWSLAFSARGDVAFAARTGKHWVVITGGTPSQPWDGIGELVYSPSGKLAYAAERDGWHVVTGAAVGPRFDAILAHTLQWSGDHVAYVGQSAGRSQVVVDGAAGPVVDGAGRLTCVDGRCAYVARIGLDYHVVVDGAVGPKWAQVDELALAGKRVAYSASDGESWRVVVDGVAGPAVDRVDRVIVRRDGRHVAWVGRLAGTAVLALDDTPIATAAKLRADAVAFRPDADGLAYVLPEAGGERVVVDQTPGPRFDHVGAPVWSATGRLAYSARRGATALIVADGHELPAGQAVGEPVFSPDGRRLGHVVRQGKLSHVVVDGHDEAFDLVFEDSLVFSTDGRRWAVVAGDLARERLFFAIEGGRRVPIAVHDLYSSAATSSVNPLQAWARAEADRAAKP